MNNNSQQQVPLKKKAKKKGKSYSGVKINNKQIKPSKLSWVELCCAVLHMKTQQNYTCSTAPPPLNCF